MLNIMEVHETNLMFGKVCADACDDADSILTDDGF